MMIDDKDQGNNEEGLAVFLNDLQNERKKYYQNLESFVEKVLQNIKIKCAEAQVGNDKNMEKFVEEFMKDISKIFS